MKNKKTEFSTLTTEFEQKLDANDPWNDYPRPQLKRDSFLSLNGVWNLEGKNKKGEIVSDKIVVPFPPQSRLSQTNGLFDNIDLLKYSRKFEICDDFLKERVIIHFGAVDQYAKLFINGKFVGDNHGGYLPFEFDITDFIRSGDNDIEVIAFDDLSVDYPYGKQRKKRGGMWYTPISGIWQSVWLESVCDNFIKSIRITPTLESVKIDVVGGEKTKTLLFEGDEYTFDGNSFTLRIQNPVLWSPEDPHLYDFRLKSGKDEVSSYFALRTVSLYSSEKYAYISLNGKPYYFHGILDQGYFPDGIYLPATSEGYSYDIQAMKRLGFNMLRKHAKVEPDIFYYLCDKYGMIVFRDFVNSGRYNFVFDTALPTAFLKCGVIHCTSKKQRHIFKSTSAKTVEFLYNHPSVCYYTIFNEGWGQHSADRIYGEMKTLDSSRIWDTASGWFKTFKSDVKSEHVYFKPVKIRCNKKRPLVLSEFGGYSFKVKENSFNQTQNYGYRFYSDKKQFEDSIEHLYLKEVLPCVEKGLCATVLTQLSDVEDETNGLLTYDRRVVKIDEKVMTDISEKIFKSFEKTVY